ncbi:hypothetical protein A2U01_0057462, partial [Trifolium medium]|nr:hypothetical protein [Trifolium medium]
MAKDVEDELKEEDYEVDRSVGKKDVGRIDSNGLGSKSRSGFSPTQKEINKSTYSGWNNPTKKTGSMGSNSSSNSSLSSTTRKSDGDRRFNGSDRWRSVRSEEMEERRAKGLCFKCGGKFHPTLHK